MTRVTAAPNPPGSSRASRAVSARGGPPRADLPVWVPLYPLLRLFRSSYGPFGGDKLIFDREHNSLVVTNDGYALARELRDLTVDPVGKLILKALKSHARAWGEGTKTLAIFLLGLLEGADRLRRDWGLHPAVVTRGYQTGGAVLRAELEVARRPLTPVQLSDPGLSRTLFRKQYHDAFHPRVAEHLADLSQRALARVAPRAVTSLTRGQFSFEEHFLVQRRPGGQILDSRFEPAVVFKKGRAHPNMPARLARARLLLTTDKLYVDKPGEDGVDGAGGGFTKQVLITSPDQLDAMLDYQTTRARRLLAAITATRVEVLVSEKGLSRELEELLADAGILAVRRAKGAAIHLLSRALNLPVNTNCLAIAPGEVRVVDGVEVTRLNGLPACTVRDARLAGGTFVIRGGHDYVCEEVARHVRSAFRAVAAMADSATGGVVPGGGATEYQLARAVRAAASTTAGVTPLVYARLATALESVTLALFENAGHDLLDATLTLARLAKENPGVPVGFRSTTRGAGPVPATLRDAHGPKRHALETALELALQLLRVDHVHQHAGKARGSGAPAS